MKNVDNEFMVNSIVSKRNSSIHALNQEKFSNALRSTHKDVISSNGTMQESNVFMQSLQYKAQLNRMIIENIG